MPGRAQWHEFCYLVAYRDVRASAGYESGGPFRLAAPLRTLRTLRYALRGASDAPGPSGPRSALCAR